MAGTVFDFKDDKALQDISKDIYEAGGVVSSVCHGAIGLLNIKLSDDVLLIKDKKVN
jgi:putative intracellular protease/amidase